ncbi:hypothetical protein FA13DRAFT_1822216 [Coprinellus micaceus]|uniref:Uncharacterized protein n=1 Tax=Coprinellus micaceus TaxID=71717 RepID=A0A4Y7SAN8_COPMI|nr:hypothetical protein FA13DRAFT_1822216 [Coprinellus micaceus]
MSPDVTSAFAKCAPRDDEQGLKSLPGQTARSGGKPLMKPSASKPLLGRKPAGRIMNPKLPGTASKKPGKTQKPGRANNSKRPGRITATKSVGKAKAPSGAEAGARKPNSKGPRMAAVKPKRMERHGASNNLKRVGAKPTPRGRGKVAKRT